MKVDEIRALNHEELEKQLKVVQQELFGESSRDCEGQKGDCQDEDDNCGEGVGYDWGGAIVGDVMD